MSSLDYYNDSSKYGNYQYSSLESIVNDYMMSKEPDDFTSLSKRSKVIYQAKRGIRELYYDVTKEIKAIELDLSPTLDIVLPEDYVNYVRISWVGEDGHLRPMAVDGRMSVANLYLQDNNFNLLFDNQGNILEASKRKHNVGDVDNHIQETCYSFYYDSYVPNKDNSKVYSNGKFVIDNSSGLIRFNSDASEKSIVLEYISDGMYPNDEDIKIHKFAESALLDFIYYQLIKNRRNVPQSEKIRARKEYYNNRRIAKRRINVIKISDILQLFKGDSKVVK